MLYAFSEQYTLSKVKIHKTNQLLYEHILKQNNASVLHKIQNLFYFVSKYKSTYNQNDW